MRFPPEFIEELRNQTDIVRIVSEYVTLKKRGANYLACCPFHSEKTPSFNVHPGKGIFKCFGCGAAGDVFGFVMRIDGGSYADAIRTVAEKTGVPVPVREESPSYKKSAQEREAVLRLNEWAAEYFHEQLIRSGEGERGLAYLKSRSISDDTIDRFQLGYSLDRWDALMGHLKERGATSEELLISGLVSFKDEGGQYDRFRGRVMFPITDSQNRVIGFGGRVIGSGEPKYLNSPETPVYTKGRNLYGLGLGKNEIRRTGFAILVEGYLDCIIPFQEGVQNVVATLGTALTESQVRLLRRYMENPRIVVNFDPDSAGQAATVRSIEILLAEGFKANVLRMPTNEDPDEYVRNHGAAAFQELLRTSQPYIEYMVDEASARYNTARPSGKVEAINAVLPHLVRMRDKVERAEYAAQIADRFKVDSRIIRDELKRAATNRQSSLNANRTRAAQQTTQAECQLLELVLARADVRKAVTSNLSYEDVSELATERVFVAVMELEKRQADPTYESLSSLLQEDSERELVAGLLISDLAWAGCDDFDTLFKKATEAITSLRLRKLERRLDAIQMELGQAERERNEDLWVRLYREKAEVKRRMLGMSA